MGIEPLRVREDEASQAPRDTSAETCCYPGPLPRGSTRSGKQTLSPTGLPGPQRVAITWSRRLSSWGALLYDTPGRSDLTSVRAQLQGMRLPVAQRVPSKLCTNSELPSSREAGPLVALSLGQKSHRVGPALALPPWPPGLGDVSLPLGGSRSSPSDGEIGLALSHDEQSLTCSINHCH